MTFIRNDQATKEFPAPTPLNRHFDAEPTEVAIKERTLHMDVQKPKVMVGLKAKNVQLQGAEMLKHELAMNIGFELLFGRTSPFYTRVYEADLIDESFGQDFSLEEGFGFGLIGSDTYEPERLIAEIKEELAQAAQTLPFTAEDVERMKRKKIGFYLRAMNSIEFIANSFTRYKFNDMNLFDAVPTLEALTFDDIQQALTSVQGESQQTIFTVLPMEQEEKSA